MMVNKSKSSFNIASVFSFLIGCVGLLSIIALDKFYWHTPIFVADTWPDFSRGHLIRSAIIFISVIAVFGSLIGKRKPKLILIENDEMYLERFSIFGTLFLSIVFLLLFIFRPPAFNNLSLEGGLLENTQFLLLISCSIIFVISFFKSRNNLNIPKTIQWTDAFLAFVFLLIAMEEISWFQWILEYETPEMFEDNAQNEVTLHNFATSFSENTYYFGSFVFLVVMPFMRLLFPYFSNNNIPRLFVARPFIGLIGTIACAYNFDMWNEIFMQITFFSSIVILFAFSMFSIKSNERYLIIFIIFLIVVTQVLFLNNGENFFRIAEVTEYKEFFLPLVFFIYSLDVFIHINQIPLHKKGSRQ